MGVRRPADVSGAHLPHREAVSTPDFKFSPSFVNSAAATLSVKLVAAGEPWCLFFLASAHTTIARSLDLQLLPLWWHRSRIMRHRPSSPATSSATTSTGASPPLRPRRAAKGALGAYRAPCSSLKDSALQRTIPV
jgi:hypothetical protein